MEAIFESQLFWKFYCSLASYDRNTFVITCLLMLITMVLYAPARILVYQLFELISGVLDWLSKTKVIKMIITLVDVCPGVYIEILGSIFYLTVAVYLMYAFRNIVKKAIGNERPTGVYQPNYLWFRYLCILFISTTVLTIYAFVCDLKLFTLVNFIIVTCALLIALEIFFFKIICKVPVIHDLVYELPLVDVIFRLDLCMLSVVITVCAFIISEEALIFNVNSRPPDPYHSCIAFYGSTSLIFATTCVTFYRLFNCFISSSSFLMFFLGTHLLRKDENIHHKGFLWLRYFFLHYVLFGASVVHRESLHFYEDEEFSNVVYLIFPFSWAIFAMEQFFISYYTKVGKKTTTTQELNQIVT